jgi:tripartite-type tricarboxylate transporter receptor subunit TctC
MLPAPSSIRALVSSGLLAGLLAGVFAGGAAAQERYPSRPITVINPWAAGSATDLMARALADEFRKRLGEPVVVSVRGGGGGLVGMAALAAAAPDGHTLAFTPMTPVTIQPHLVADARSGPDTVQPVCGVTENVLAVLVHADSPLRSVADLVTAARARPLTYASPGPNSAPSLGIENVARTRGLHFVHVAYKGDAPAIADLLARQVDFAASITASAAAHLAAQRLRVLAVMSDRRHPAFPDVPTLIESGIDVQEPSYAGLFTTRGTPADVVARLERTCLDAIGSDAVRDLAARTHQVLVPQSRATWEARLRSEYERQANALKGKGVTQ